MNPLFLVALTASAQAMTPPAPRPFTVEPSSRAEHYVARTSEFVLGFAPGEVILEKEPDRVRLRWRGGRAVRPSPAGQLSSRSHYFGGAPGGWRTNVPHYAEVRYREVYPGIDLVFHGRGHAAEFDFEVAPHADPSRIRLEVDGAVRLEDGDLVLGQGGFRFRKPRIFQDLREIPGQFALHAEGLVGFEVGSYDPSRPLVIDPVITHMTFRGGVNGDRIQGIQADAAGNVYVAGYTTSPNFPAGNSAFGRLRPTFAQTAFISKYSPVVDGRSSLLWTAILGSAEPLEFSTAYAVTVDPEGNPVVAGVTSMSEFPVLNAHQSRKGSGLCSVAGTDRTASCPAAFLTKLTPDGSRLLFSTYFGGSGAATFKRVAVDAAGGIYAAGESESSFPVSPSAVQLGTRGGRDALLARFDPQGRLLYSTFYGGDRDEQVNAIVVERPGVVWILGHTPSRDLTTTPNAFQPRWSAMALSGFLARIDSTIPEGLLYASYFSGPPNSNVSVQAGSLAAGGQILFCGGVLGNLPTTPTALLNREQGVPATRVTSPSFFEGDGFVARLDPMVAGAAGLTYSAYVGGRDSDVARGCAPDEGGLIAVAGETYSSDPFFTVGSPFPYVLQGFRKLFLMRLDPAVAGGRRDSLWFGGNGSDVIDHAFFSSRGIAYLAGRTSSRSFPVTPGAAQEAYGGDNLEAKADIGLGDGWWGAVDLRQPHVAAAALVAAAGDLQVGAPNAALPTAASVQLVDASGRPLRLAGYPVTFTATNAQVNPGLALTDASGVAGTLVRLAGAGEATVRASVASTITPHTFRFRAIAGNLPVQLRLVSGDRQSGAPGAALPEPMVVQLLGNGGAPLALSGVLIAFRASGGTLSEAVVPTDANGRASVRLTLPGQAATVTVTATLAGAPAVTFTATSGAGSPLISAVIAAGAFGAGSVIASGGWFEIYGAGLSAVTREWEGRDFRGSEAPTSLDGVSVTVAGRPAFLRFISATQINAQAPGGLPAGPAVVRVVTPAGSAEFSVTAAPRAPGLLAPPAFRAGSRQYVAALHGDGAFAGRPNLIPGVGFRDVGPGDRVVIYAIGAGDVTPAVPAGAIAGAANRLPDARLLVGGREAMLEYAGLAVGFVGLYQINAVIPGGVSGDVEVRLTVESASSAPGVFLALR